MEVPATIQRIKKNLGTNCVSWSTFVEVIHNVCGREPEDSVVKVEEWYGL